VVAEHQHQQQEVINQEIKRINLFLILSLSILIFINILHLYSFVAYSEEPVTTTTVTGNGTLATQHVENQQDIVSILFSNSVTQMLLSTFIIAIVGVLITKLKNFRKKLDMIEVLTKALIKFQKQAEEREAKFNKILEKHTAETEKRIDELEKEIEHVKNEATKALIQYLRENSFDRKRD